MNNNKINLTLEITTFLLIITLFNKETQRKILDSLAPSNDLSIPLT